MPQVSVEVSGRSYKLACGAGEEEQVIALSRRVDEHASKLGKPTTPATESQKLLMGAILLAERLTEKEAEVAALSEQIAELKQAGTGGAPEERVAEMEAAMAEMLDKATGKIESVVDMLRDAG